MGKIRVNFISFTNVSPFFVISSQFLLFPYVSLNEILKFEWSQKGKKGESKKEKKVPEYAYDR